MGSAVTACSRGVRGDCRSSSIDCWCRASRSGDQSVATLCLKGEGECLSFIKEVGDRIGELFLLFDILIGQNNSANIN